MHAIPSRQHRSYDHRLKLLVRNTGDLTTIHGLGIPRSTARGWLEADRPVVSLEVLDQDTLSLQAEVVQLHHRVAKLRALLRFVLTVLRLSGFDLQRRRLDAPEKESIVRAIDRGREVGRLPNILRCPRMSPARYHAWKRRRKDYELADRSSCPKSSPEQLTFEEGLRPGCRPEPAPLRR
ncbi:MAG: hypothetical protein RL885_12965 [Planctomycetota bacterium]